MTTYTDDRTFLGPTGLNAAAEYIATTIDADRRDLEATLSLSILGATLEVDLSHFAAGGPPSDVSRARILSSLALLADLSETLTRFADQYETAAAEYLAT
jgi:hypothetical protein